VQKKTGMQNIKRSSDELFIERRDEQLSMPRVAASVFSYAPDYSSSKKPCATVNQMLLSEIRRVLTLKGDARRADCSNT
jgi:hypothetical protein